MARIVPRRWLSLRRVVASMAGGLLLAAGLPAVELLWARPLPFSRTDYDRLISGGEVSGDVPVRWWCRGGIVESVTATRCLLEPTPVDARAPQGIDGLPSWAAGSVRRSLAAAAPAATGAASTSADGAAPQGRPWVIVVEGRGWPWRAWSASAEIRQGRITGIRGGVRAPAWLAPPGPVPVIVPLRPIVAGLLADAAVMAAVLLALATLSVIVLRAWRYERGLCPGCGYSRLGRYDHPCPECGHGHT
jgi:hypothetical protein